ncbi:S1 RNA-binding domain-containing protein [Feifania hominis]|uniref:30S ribosomal protein S1 n=1 Tax=Feifania hominis TaxID=2763660 RepID=A0A926DFH5_9FIRM|nr:S1 RNA-binding domain-containing protein [Feifania hominis]MBC8537193.1 30S ribosomal protein S1 [Feifania hominis]
MGATGYTPEGSAKSAFPRGELTAADLAKALENKTILEARAKLCDERHNLVVELSPGVTGVIEKSEVALGADGEDFKNIAIITRVGKHVCFKVLSLTQQPDGGVVAQLSRRAAQRECVEQYVSRLRPGDIIDAKVTHIEPFGAFVDIGCGFVSLISIDNISVSRIASPRDRFQIGDEIKAVVKSVEGGRVTLTHKELLGTWEQNAALFSPGQTAAGIVRSVEPYGIFVELMPNLAGLAEWREGVSVGQTAAVYIKNIIPEKMKLKLIIVDSFDAAPAKPQNRYFIDEGRLSVFRYSPENCKKLIETRFE